MPAEGALALRSRDRRPGRRSDCTSTRSAPLYEITQHQALGSVAHVYDNRHGLLLKRTMTVKASTANDQKSTGREIQAYDIDETAQWVSLWASPQAQRQLLLGPGRRSWTGKLLHDLAAGLRLRATSACSGLSPESIRAAAVSV